MSDVIAVDGPSASGKSTVAKRVAKRLGFFYVDSGAIYRGITWLALEHGIDVSDADAVIAHTERSEWVFRAENHISAYSIDGFSPVDELRTTRIHEAVSVVATQAKVRAFVNEKLRSLTSLGSLTIDGRDIGTVVFPDARFKFYLDASPEERAQRRYRELVAKGEAEKAQEVLESLRRRDQMDTTRTEAPLQVAKGARVIDTTSMSIEDVVDLIVTTVGEKD